MTLTRYLALPDVWSMKGGRDTGSGPLLILGNRRLESCSNRVLVIEVKRLLTVEGFAKLI